MLPKIGDINIHYQTQGSGPPLLLIMGLSLSLLDWGTELLSLLSPHHQLILFDNRDAGATSPSDHPYTLEDMADDTANLLDALNIPKAHIFGVSMGGAIAQHLALRHPTKIDKLILGCTFAGGDCSQPGDFSGLLNGDLSALLFTPDYIQQHQQTLKDFFAKTAPAHSTGSALHQQMNAISTHNTCHTLANITAPTLVITGDLDTAIPPSNSDVLVSKIPNAKLATLANAAHGFSLSHAQETAQLIHTFLK
ncbi:MAG: alpha/beta hydrolase [Thermosynechococcaceae cyanobacterium]